MKLAHNNKTTLTGQTLLEFQSMFSELGFDLNQQEIVEWIDSDVNDSGVQILLYETLDISLKIFILQLSLIIYSNVSNVNHHVG